MSPAKRFRVIPTEQGMTLRNLIARRMRELDRKQCSRLIRAGGVYVNRLRVRLPQVLVAPGERITVYPEALDAVPLDETALPFVHRGPDFVVIDKPPGVPVAPVRETAVGCLSEALVRLLESEGVTRPYVGVVHRLDRGASGLVLFTVRDVANKSLHKQFREHAIRRTYRIRVHGDPPERVTCEAPLVKLRTGGVRIGQVGAADAKPAVTHFRRLASFGDGQHVLEVTLETGRTHQIRAHAGHLGFPVVGDHRYGDGGGDGDGDGDGERDRLCLHAHRLEFEHPIRGGALAFEAPLPAWAGD